MVATILSRQHHAPGITATAVKAQASTTCGLFAALEAGNLAHLRRPFNRAVPLLKKLSSRASATTCEGCELL